MVFSGTLDMELIPSQGDAFWSEQRGARNPCDQEMCPF